MNDLSDWKITDLERRDNNLTTWYFRVTKPDGKRLISNANYEGKVWTCRTALFASVWSHQTYGGASQFYVHAGTEAAAVRKISRWLNALASEWNVREKIKAEVPKQVTFDGKTPRIMDAGHQLTAGPVEMENETDEEKIRNTIFDRLYRTDRTR